MTAHKDVNEIWGLNSFAHLRLTCSEVISVSLSEPLERSRLWGIHLHCDTCTLDVSELPFVCYLRKQLFKIKLVLLP